MKEGLSKTKPHKPEWLSISLNMCEYEAFKEFELAVFGHVCDNVSMF